MRPAARLAGLFLVAAGVLAAPAQAQTKKELAARIIALQQADYELIGRGVAGQTAQQVMDTVAQALVQVPPDKREALAKDLQAEVRKFHDSIAPQLAERAGKLGPVVAQPQLEEKFSEDELKAVLAFMESPASKKYREFGAQLPMLIADKLITETRASVEPRLKTLEKTLQGKIKAAATASAAPPKPAASGAKK